MAILILLIATLHVSKDERWNPAQGGHEKLLFALVEELRCLLADPSAEVSHSLTDAL